MKLLVSTHKGQGQRKSDFCFCRDGELLYIGFACDSDRGNPDGGCGCQRSFCGMDEHRATTTGEVIEAGNVTEVEFIETYMASQERAGWLKNDRNGSLRKSFIEAAKEVIEIAQRFPVGAILEKRCEVIQVRDVAAESIKREDCHGG